MLKRNSTGAMLNASFSERTPVEIVLGQLTAHLQECAILRDSFGVSLQFLLIFVSAAFLVAKWKMETPKRSSLVFFLDMSKQLLAIVVVQALNIIFSIGIDAVSAKAEDQCSTFWSVLVADATLGLLLNLLFLWVSQRLLRYDSGVYGESSADEVDARGEKAELTAAMLGKWCMQLFVFITCIALSQVIMFVLMTKTMSFWEKLGNVGTSWIHRSRPKLLYVMILSPLVLNILMFFVLDDFIMHSPVSTPMECRSSY